MRAVVSMSMSMKEGRNRRRQHKGTNSKGQRVKATKQQNNTKGAQEMGKKVKKGGILVGWVFGVLFSYGLGHVLSPCVDVQVDSMGKRGPPRTKRTTKQESKRAKRKQPNKLRRASGLVCLFPASRGAWHVGALAPKKIRKSTFRVFAHDAIRRVIRPKTRARC